MSWLCWFRQCKWLRIMNVLEPDMENRRVKQPCGLYQCSRCKTISMGAPR